MPNVLQPTVVQVESSRTTTVHVDAPRATVVHVGTPGLQGPPGPPGPAGALQSVSPISGNALSVAPDGGLFVQKMQWASINW